MLPLAFNVLSLEEIAEYWSREIAGVRTMAEMYAELLSAFWRDDLTVFGSSGKVPVDRRRFLELVRRESVHPGFTLVDSAGVIPPAIEKQFGRSIIIDTTTYVVLPSGFGLDRRHRRNRISKIGNDVVRRLSRCIETRSPGAQHDSRGTAQLLCHERLRSSAVLVSRHEGASGQLWRAVIGDAIDQGRNDPTGRAAGPRPDASGRSQSATDLGTGAYRRDDPIAKATGDRERPSKRLQEVAISRRRRRALNIKPYIRF